ncbi:membrane protein [Mycobacterium noviomagense]|uniref:Membrane protein n=2 Tax=Mycobacterium noviomagense TaxID=459858 RepID=A0A7I7PEG5_9MYCO|nr:membrane protein [Mycobacterium noviomagense]
MAPEPYRPELAAAHAQPMTSPARRAGVSFAESFVGADGEADAQRRRALRRMKVVALSFLVGASVVFLGCRWAQAGGSAAAWIGYVRAAAEAGMVGAMADWFAVTALFKHPLGIPIPHTAIIKRKKDQLGEGLGTFVRENFLSPPVVESKLRDAQIPSRLGKWLSQADHAQRVAAETATVLRVLVELLRDDDVQHVIDRMIIKRIAEPQWGPPVGRVLATLLAENRQEALIQLLADRAFHWSLNAGEVIQRVVERDSPSWSPRFIDHLVGDRIHRELMDFTDKVRRDPNHELRRSATRFLFDFAEDLQHDPATIARAEAVKEQLMARDEITNAAATAWKTLKRLVLEGVDDPSSALRSRITDTVIRIGESLRDDADLRDKVDNWIVRAAQHLVSQYGVEITTIITDTIERWDAEEASRRIELHVGRDLQFIRINGTVVGALAGLLIYTVAQLLF